MKLFLSKLKQHNPPSDSNRKWIFVPYDQLTDQIGPLSDHPANTLSIILIETSWKAARRPYHKQKLYLILSNMRHFAIEQAQRGVHVHYVFGDKPYSTLLSSLCTKKIFLMRPAERELRADIATLIHNESLTVLPHEGWVSTQEDFRNATKNKKPWRMDRFYQYMRKKTNILMDGNKPIGGKFSFDSENRRPWKGTPPPATPPSFPLNAIKQEVISLINTKFAHHPGTLTPQNIPSTKEEAQEMWNWAKSYCLTYFGPYEDAMSTLSTNIFHTRISPLLHILRLLPKKVIIEAESLDVPLNSKEGFIRQILGWREFVYRIHEETDGFRVGSSTRESPSDAGYEKWKGTKWKTSTGVDGGSLINTLSYQTPLPPTFWGVPSGMNCLDSVVKNVWEEGYAHHIPRLMVLANIATLLEIDPRSITDWFWVAFFDAFDWVVEPNVLGMGTFAAGEVMSTKPYISGSGYINKMSNYCTSCVFHPKKNCPITRLYWAFLARHQDTFQNNFRMKMILSMLNKRTPAVKKEDAEIFIKTCSRLSAGQPISPTIFP